MGYRGELVLKWCTIHVVQCSFSMTTEPRRPPSIAMHKGCVILGPIYMDT